MQLIYVLILTRASRKICLNNDDVLAFGQINDTIGPKANPLNHRGCNIGHYFYPSRLFRNEAVNG